MESSLWKIIIPLIIFSFISAVLILLWFFQKKKPTKRETIKENRQNSPAPSPAQKKWRFLAIFWPLLCILFTGIIILQSIQKTEGRFASDAVFAILPLIFFAIGMTILHRLLKERSYATILTTATLISNGRRTHAGKSNFFPEYKFQIGEKTYHVISKNSYNTCSVKEGKQVELYYAPENPNLFYVPIMQKQHKRWSILLCSVGIIYPLIGLFAPQLRTLILLLNK